MITAGGSEQTHDKFSGTVAWRVVDDETDGISFSRAAPILEGSKFLSKVGGTLRSFLGAADIPCSYNVSISPDHSKVVIFSIKKYSTSRKPVLQKQHDVHVLIIKIEQLIINKNEPALTQAAV